MNDFIKQSYEQGVLAALQEAGITKTAWYEKAYNVLHKGAPAITGALIGGVGAGEGNRLKGALTGGALGYGGGRLARHVGKTKGYQTYDRAVQDFKRVKGGTREMYDQTQRAKSWVPLEYQRKGPEVVRDAFGRGTANKYFDDYAGYAGLGGGVLATSAFSD